MFTQEKKTHSPEETRSLGEKIGARVKPGTIIALIGELGTGKTAFVQGLARGLAVPPAYYVTSPTYTLMNEYPGRCPLYHADVYRLDGEEDMEEIGLSEMLYGNGVTAIEWADRLLPALPDHTLTIHFETLGEDSRKLCLSAAVSESAEIFRGI